LNEEIERLNKDFINQFNISQCLHMVCLCLEKKFVEVFMGIKS